ncbi:DUF6939 family protein [Ktedonospora formicarum]|uniref:Uncharacterized protein n=1 Tax=Ktedonospora formicarum TaxID=2778364 RepID=A0A8J3I5T9_9CHLR|nr:hypothetical protein [Ktedonospora formicarum]GHO46428.1 hypothetical protein KSX_45910 [Ktedonospora formicarum]
MPLIVESHRLNSATLLRRYGQARVLDVTSRGVEPWIRVSPFYPHGAIPVPFSPGYVGASVEGIWQGLKVFERADVDISKFSVTTMKGLKRSVRANGPVLGHREGVHGTRLLGYLDARYTIYLPTYLWVIEHNLQAEIATLRQLSANETVILLDYETNADVTNLQKPLSHAALIKLYIENLWPNANSSSTSIHQSK